MGNHVMGPDPADADDAAKTAKITTAVITARARVRKIATANGIFHGAAEGLALISSCVKACTVCTALRVSLARALVSAMLVLALAARAFAPSGRTGSAAP